jgi:SNF2 family DNA or RNA helicase
VQYNFRFVPYEHQLHCLEKSWAKNHFALFMDMGTGKSKVLIDTMALLYDNDKIQGALIVASKGVYGNWIGKELPQHMPDHVPNLCVAWSPEQTKKKAAELQTLFTPNEKKLRILVMNVEAFSTKRGATFAESFVRSFAGECLVAVDESTTIKNRTANRTKALTKVGSFARYRRIMTGSPITKSPLDLFSQCEFLSKQALGHSSFWTFQARYCKLIRRTMGPHSFNQIVGYQNLGELNEIIEPFSYRVRKEDCLDLPEKVYLRREVELTEEQHKVYEMMKRAAIAEIEGSVISATIVLTQLLKLQQICSGFITTDDGELKEFPSNKLQELLDVIEETDGKVIIWANFTHNIKAITAALAKAYGENSVASYFGETDADDRQRIVERFQDPGNELRFFVGQPRTGGYGLTLTEARTVVYYSNGFDLEVRLQSEDRAHRIGQRNNVTYVDIVVAGKVDDKILNALRSKINIATAVMAEGHKKWLI